jgi:hypothetical protein
MLEANEIPHEGYLFENFFKDEDGSLCDKDP